MDIQEKYYRAVAARYDGYTDDYFRDNMLALSPAEIDKREGSIIWDSVSPVAVVGAKLAVLLKGYSLSTNELTAEGDDLDARGNIWGIERYESTFAVKLGIFTGDNDEPIERPIGSLLLSKSDSSPLAYEITEPHTDSLGNAIPGQYRLQCQAVGSIGNDYVGELLPVNYKRGVKTATMTDLLIPARDTELDEPYRDRILEYLRRKPYGWNVAEYRTRVLAMNGVGAVQVYPTYKGAETVLVSIIGADMNPASQTLIDTVQTILDPIPFHQLGLGEVPINHTAVVNTPETISIDISATVYLETGFTIDQIKINAVYALTLLIEEYQREFGKNYATVESGSLVYDTYVLIARISAELMKVQGIQNVTDITVNSAASDFRVIGNNALQQFPVLGVVSLATN